MNVSEIQVARMRRAFRALNRLMILMWRLGLGSTMAGPRRGYVMVLITTGRKTGRRRLAPLNYAEEAGAIYCIAGFGRRTHWLANLLADPACEIWLPDGRRLSGSAEIVTDEPTRIEFVRRLLIRAGFATKLAEPGLDPMLAEEIEIAQLGSRYGHRYEVVRILITGSVSGPGGPGDLRWVLPTVAVAAILACALWKRVR